jgi:NitT/TauT family transport system substrate-binding protein
MNTTEGLWMTIRSALMTLAILGPPLAFGHALHAQPAGGAKEKVLIRFTWKLKGEYAPLFVALDKGYYAAEGLDVQLAEGSGAETVVKMIGLGTGRCRR